MRTVTIDGTDYYLRKFTVREYFAANIKAEDHHDVMVKSLALSLSNEDGSQVYGSFDDAVKAIDDMPFSTALQLTTVVSEVNGMDPKAATS